MRISRVAASGAHSIYLGSIPPEIELPTTFETMSLDIKHAFGVMVIGVRYPDTGKDIINPPDDDSDEDEDQSDNGEKGTWRKERDQPDPLHPQCQRRR